ncbi:myb-like DNA-binding protein FlbD [Exophiala dermatitidis NIH/UT8656]|uniref:Myb-like DNA-binding protein FlbD n=1 Tax=Exophiala dermatitidis (strain ATCC 34100 / CBS 525.76 / NIH/UT8656) TaxID=858893 RepID=H6C8V3_EXODN|nr:myb-like DNA-binding protein FlbD [Exophiala dermatitidis NIH/UT8656]EHY60529.1 myb-like DNA-binding protein FlbD [Exophiala dermatitidis NIH/UT8656]KAJ4581688.1 hypothetical protein HRR79_000706 [Exophiala dermatitidis]
MSPASRRGPWLPDEDAALLHLVRTQGPNNWVRISQHMQHRSPKQCRERYHQNLKPSLNHEPISPEEGEMIEQLVQEMGKRWAEIARRLGNRSDNAVKNWWNGSMNRRKRNNLQQSGGPRPVGYRNLPMPASSSTPQLYGRETQIPHQDLRAYPSLTHRPQLQQASYSFSHTNTFTRERTHPLPAPTSQTSVLGHSQCQEPAYPSRGQSHHSLRFPPSESNSYPSVESVPSKRRPEWQLPSLYPIESSIHSPAATDISHASLHQQAPSLVSDNQSNCSISPRTISSPRPSLPAPKELMMPMWPGGCARDPAGHYQDQNLNIVKPENICEETIRNAAPRPIINVPSSSLPGRPSLSHSQSLPEPLDSPSRPVSQESTRSYNPSYQTDTTSPRDSRMKLSSLLG